MAKRILLFALVLAGIAASATWIRALTQDASPGPSVGVAEMFYAPG